MKNLRLSFWLSILVEEKCDFPLRFGDQFLSIKSKIKSSYQQNSFKIQFFNEKYEVYSKIVNTASVKQRTLNKTLIFFKIIPLVLDTLNSIKFFIHRSTPEEKKKKTTNFWYIVFLLMSFTPLNNILEKNLYLKK